MVGFTAASSRVSDALAREAAGARSPLPTECLSSSSAIDVPSVRAGCFFRLVALRPCCVVLLTLMTCVCAAASCYMFGDMNLSVQLEVHSLLSSSSARRA